jgi:hypothetical protein
MQGGSAQGESGSTAGGRGGMPADAGSGGTKDDVGGGGLAEAGQAGASGDNNAPEGGAGGMTSPCDEQIALDLSERVDPEVTLPQQGAWQYVGMWCLGAPTAIALGQDVMKVVVRDWHSTFSEADLLVDRGSFLEPSWYPIEGGVFTQGPVVLATDRPVVLGSGLDAIPWATRRQDDAWGYFDPVGPPLVAPPVLFEITPGVVFTLGRGLDHHIRYQVHSPESTGWQGNWYLLGLTSRAQPAAVPDGEGGVHVIVRDSAGVFTYARWRADEKTRWGVDGWTKLSGACFSSAPMLIQRSPAAIDVFGRGHDGSLYWQTMLDGAWQGWLRISGSVGSSPLAVADSAQGFFVFAEDEEGGIWMRRYRGGWSAWTHTGGRAADAAVDVEFPGSALALGDGDVGLFLCGYGQSLYKAFTP